MTLYVSHLELKKNVSWSYLLCLKFITHYFQHVEVFSISNFQ